MSNRNIIKNGSFSAFCAGMMLTSIVNASNTDSPIILYMFLFLLNLLWWILGNTER